VRVPKIRSGRGTASLFGAGAILAFAAACGGPGAGPTATVAPSVVGCGGTDGTPVAIANFAYSPAQVTVSSGAVVTWTNSDTAAHTVTFDDGLDCGQIARDGTLSATFATAGSFAYHCTIHPAMTGTVVVQ
jgi:plastocyanin